MLDNMHKLGLRFWPPVLLCANAYRSSFGKCLSCEQSWATKEPITLAGSWDSGPLKSQ